MIRIEDVPKVLIGKFKKRTALNVILRLNSATGEPWVRSPVVGYIGLVAKRDVVYHIANLALWLAHYGEDI